MDEFIDQVASQFKTVKVFFVGDDAPPQQGQNPEQDGEEGSEDELARITTRALTIGQAVQPLRPLRPLRPPSPPSPPNPQNPQNLLHLSHSLMLLISNIGS